MNRKLLGSLVAILIIAITAIVFIKLNNDHAACSETIERSTNAQGQVVTTKRHVCEEKYAL